MFQWVTQTQFDAPAKLKTTPKKISPFSFCFSSFLTEIYLKFASAVSQIDTKHLKNYDTFEVRCRNNN